MAGIGVVWSGTIDRDGLELCGAHTLNPNDIGGFTACLASARGGHPLHVGTTVLFEEAMATAFMPKKLTILSGWG